MLNIDRIMMKQAVACMQGFNYARTDQQLPLGVFDAQALSEEEAEKLQFEENMQRVIAETRRG